MDGGRALMHDRALTRGEVQLTRAVFGDAIATDAVRIRRRKWAFFQPARIVMAPMGHIHFHPASPHWHDDYSGAPLAAQGLFLHEMTHVWQAQTRGRWYLVLMRHPFCRYDYALRPGWMLDRYGLEQQAEIIRHYWLLRQGVDVAGAPPLSAYRAMLPPGFAP